MPADPVYVQLLDELLDLHYTKSGGYGTGADPLANFTAVAGAFDLPAWRYPRERALEKLTRIESLERQGRLDEIEEEHLDVASLMLCAEVLRRRTLRPAAEESRAGSPLSRHEPPDCTPLAVGAPSAASLIGMTTLVGQAIDSAEPRSPSPHPVAPVGTRPRMRTPEGVVPGFTSHHPGSGLSAVDPTTPRGSVEPGHLETGLDGVDRCVLCERELDPDDHKTSPHRGGYAHDECIEFHGHVLFAERLRELAKVVYAAGASGAGLTVPAGLLEIEAALRTAADLIGPSTYVEGPYVARCAHPSDLREEGPERKHPAHTSCKSPVFGSDQAAGEALRSRIEERAGQDTAGVGRHTPSLAHDGPARLRDAQRGDDGWVRA